MADVLRAAEVIRAALQHDLVVIHERHTTAESTESEVRPESLIDGRATRPGGPLAGLPRLGDEPQPTPVRLTAAAEGGVLADPAARPVIGSTLTPPAETVAQAAETAVAPPEPIVDLTVDRPWESDLDLPPPSGPPIIAAAEPWAPWRPDEQDDFEPVGLPLPALAEARRLPRRMLIRPALSALGLLGVVLLLFFGYALYGTGLLESRAQHSLRGAYRAEVAASARRPDLPPSRVLAELRIPKIGLKTVVAEGVSRAVLAKSPGFVPPLIESPQPPPVVIVGHRTVYGGPFRHLGDLRVGDEVTVRTPQGVVASYSVERKQTLSSGTRLGSPDGVQRIYLVSADPAYTGGGRLIVVGRRTDAGAALVAPSAPPVPIPDLPGSAPGAVVALLAFLVVFSLAFWRNVYVTVWSAAARRTVAFVVLMASVVACLMLLGSLSPIL